MRLFRKREDPTEPPAPPQRTRPAEPLRNRTSGPTRASTPQADRAAPQGPPAAVSPTTQPAAPGAEDALPPPRKAPEARLSDLLAEAITTHERELIVVRRVEQLAFFEREISGLTAILSGALRRGHAAGVRQQLEQIVDAVSDLQDVVVSRFSPPQEPLPPPRLEPSPTDGPSLEGLEPEPDAAAWEQVLQSDCEGVLDEIGDIRDVLAGDEDLFHLVTDEPDTRGREARQQIGKLLVALGVLLRDCVERLGRVDEGEEAAEAIPTPLPARSAPVPAPAAPSRPAPPPVPPAPAAPAATDAPPPVAPVPPVARPPAAPAPAEATGLALAREPGPLDIFPEAPSGPDYEHLSEEEAVRQLQRFYDEHSGDSGLARGDEQELERMARQLVGLVCQGYAFSATDFAARLKRLKETFALRKRLHNAITLTEFKAYFRPPR